MDREQILKQISLYFYIRYHYNTINSPYQIYSIDSYYMVVVEFANCTEFNYSLTFTNEFGQIISNYERYHEYGKTIVLSKIILFKELL